MGKTQGVPHRQTMQATHDAAAARQPSRPALKRPEHVEDGFAALAVGTTATFTKTVGETDVYLFAGITGDLYRNHVDEEYMRGGPYGGRIAHGALLVGYMSAASSKLTERSPIPVVSYGYDRIRFIKGVRLGDTVTVGYQVTEHLPDEAKTLAQVTCTNQRGEVVAVATHIMKFV
jgi:acyl dehydratase